MKKILFIFFISLFSFFPSFIIGFEDIESIERYEVNIKVKKNSSIEVLEIIDYDFDTNLKRGIYRKIKTTFIENGKTYRLNIEDIEVTGDDGLPYLFEVKNGKHFLTINVGDDVPRFSGVHRFNIKYNASPAFSHQKEYDRLYWNAIEGDWNINIYRALIIVYFPEPITDSNLVSNCYVGFFGSTNDCLVNNFQYDLYNKELVDRVIYADESFLGNGRGLTIDLKIPKGVVDEVEPEEILPLPLFFSFAIIFSLIFPLTGLIKVHKKGRDANKKKVIVRQYDSPKDVNLSDAGLILKRRFGNKELVGELISLAIKGYIKIISGKKKGWGPKKSNFLFLRIKDIGEDLSSTEKSVLSSIFHSEFKIEKVKAKEYLANSNNPQLEEDIDAAIEISLLSKFKNRFYLYFKDIKKKAKQEAFEKGFFEKSFRDGVKEGITTGFKYLLILILIIVTNGLIVFLFFSDRTLYFWNIILFLTILFSISFFILTIFFSNMWLPKRTEKGVTSRDHLIGLKEYISVAEKERMEFHFDPKSNLKLFEKLLPFAVVLGVEKKWVSHLKDLNYQSNWYSDTRRGTFSVSAFNSLSRSISFSSGISSSGSSSSGSGGSGGGRGGGGGGSR